MNGICECALRWQRGLSLVLLFQFHGADKLSVVAGAIVDINGHRVYVQLDTIIEIFNNDLY
uniref:Uncharacterized protein n=1 Tax=Glossina palpalis gambiensis TaxID=67801 RepID=A0A1B0BPQ2_9MUSC